MSFGEDSEFSALLTEAFAKKLEALAKAEAEDIFRRASILLRSAKVFLNFPSWKVQQTDPNKSELREVVLLESRELMLPSSDDSTDAKLFSLANKALQVPPNT